MDSVDLHPDQTAQLAETFGLLGDPTRLAIVIACLNGEIAAGGIAEKLDVTPSLVSHHLRLLRAARMLRSTRRGKQVFYAMDDACVRDVLKIMIDHVLVHSHGDAESQDEGEH